VRLLALERAPADPLPIREMFLSAHSVKGAAAILGLDDLRDLAHAMEDVLAALRDTGQPLDAETADLLFRTVDRLGELVERAVPGGPSGDRAAADLADALRVRAAGAPTQGVPAPAGRPAGAPPRVLLVEDSATVRMLETMQLVDAGIEVEAAGDGRQALLRALDEPYDVVVTGVEVRGLRGLDLVAALRAVPAYRDRPMVVMTSDENPADRRRAAEIGVQAYIRRGSFGQQRLLDAVWELIEPRPEGARPAVPPAALLPDSVLIVDDSSANRRLTTGLVERLGYRAQTAANGREAVEALSREPWAAVLMDCRMPEMDGFEATAEIRRREGGAGRTPIIALSADARPADRERCLAAGMDDFLAKPVRQTELEATLRRWTRPDAAATAAPPRVEPAEESEDPLDPTALEWVEELAELGSADEVPELFGAFIAETESRLVALREAASRGDSDALARIAHSLKGSAGSFGARQVSRLAAELDESVAAGSPRPADDLVRRIEAAFRRARAALEAHPAIGPGRH
jgi:CheY-like chemotaxis protein